MKGEGGAAIAVIGIGCRFPGGVVDVQSYWRLLAAGQDAIGEIPADRMDIRHYYNERPATAGHIMSRWGGYLERLDEFDADFFGIPPRDAERLDPQQRLLLETTWEALEDAGVDALGLEGSRTGVFVGQWVGDFENRLFSDPQLVDFPMTLGSGRYAAAGRISYVLGLRGASFTIDAACSSSLAAVHLGVRSLREGESELALAGGVNVVLQPHIHIAYSQSKMMASDGRCRFGDASGSGYVRSEGAGMVALKRLDRALADGDRIYAVIRGSAVNNDGRSSGAMGRPSRIGQEELLRSAYADAGVSPGSVAYLEAHGTGTRAGDPVELGALASVLAQDRAPGARAFVGSVKTNFGHTEAAAGIAGMIKAALVLQHGAIPPSLHFNTPNRNVPWADLPFTIPGSLQSWPAGLPRVAGVSAYGIGGTNAHVVLEGIAPATIAEGTSSPAGPLLLPLSARSEPALRSLASQYAERLERCEANEASDICWSAATRRSGLEQRAAFVAKDRVALVDALRTYASGGPATAEGQAFPASGKPKIAFVCPGQGAQWTGMARQLIASEPVFFESLERCDTAASPYLGCSILEQLALDPGAPNYRLDRIEVIQPVLVALSIAYADWLRSIGIVPDAVVGHSMGEVGAMHLAGVLNLDQAMRIICRRSLLMSATRGQGAMAMIELSMADIEARIAGLESRVSVAVSNGPRGCVISGDPAAVKQVMDECERAGVFCRLVKVDVASHSPQMEGPAAALAAELHDLVPGTAHTACYSSVLARRADGAEFDASYWGRNMRRPVRFMDSIGAMLTDGISIFIELTPHPLLASSIQQTAQALAAKNITTATCGRREEPDLATLLSVPASLWTLGYPLKWEPLLRRQGRFVSLPLYPWQRTRHWVPAADLLPAGQAARASAARLDEVSAKTLHRLQWIESPAPDRVSPSAQWLIVAADSELATALGERLTAAGHRSVSVVAPTPREAIDVAFGSSRSAALSDPAHIVLLAASGAEAYLPLQLLQAVQASPAASAARLWVVTNGAQKVESTSRARIDVDAAGMWGAFRVIAEEQPERRGGLIDLDPASTAAQSASALAAHLLAADGEDQVAFRGGHRYALRVVAGVPTRQEPFSWRADATCLITGGLGGVGLRIARGLVDLGVRRLLLVGRTALPPRGEWASLDSGSEDGRRVAAIRALESAGAFVQTAAVDVADETRMREFLNRYEAELWPAIRGVVHGAGALDNQLAGSMGREQFDAVLRAKLRGAQVLDRLLPDLDLFIGLSSTGTFLAQAGQANYAAANAGLEAVMHDRRARGSSGQSIAWGVWQGTGLVRGEAGERNVAEMARQGIRSLSPEQGTTIFSWLCGRSDATDIVLPIDWNVFHRARAGRDVPLYRGVIDHSAADVAPEVGGLAGRLASASASEQRALLESAVRAALGHILKIAPARIEPRRTFGAMGLGSLDAMELRNRLEEALGRSFSATLAWNYPTIDTLVAHLASMVGGAATSTSAAPAASQTAPATETQPALAEALREVAALSDDEALLALRGARTRGKR